LIAEEKNELLSFAEYWKHILNQNIVVQKRIFVRDFYPPLPPDKRTKIYETPYHSFEQD
jgi:hypothetical protein